MLFRLAFRRRRGVHAIVEAHFAADAARRVGDEVVALGRNQEVLDDPAEIALRELRADDERGPNFVVESDQELVEVLSLEIRINGLFAAEQRLRARGGGILEEVAGIGAEVVAEARTSPPNARMLMSIGMLSKKRPQFEYSLLRPFRVTSHTNPTARRPVVGQLKRRLQRRAT